MILVHQEKHEGRHGNNFYYYIVCCYCGALAGFLLNPSGRKVEGAVSNGIAAGCWSAGCMAQLLIIALPVAAGLFLLGLIFG
jgi:hypothetical protein